MGTSHLLLLGISERAVSLAWLAGPLSGLLVQPIVGFISDTCTSPLGRRRPFLLAGTAFTSAALLLFANAQQVAHLLPTSADVSGAALGIAICAFFLLDFAVQAIQAPLRALVTDFVPSPQRALANSYIGVFTGLGNLLGGLLAAVRLGDIFGGSDVQALFSASAVILCISVAACVLATPEERLRGDYSYDSESEDAAVALLPRVEQGNRWESTYQTLRDIPRPFWRVFAIQLCTWVGFFTLFVYVNSWVGTNIYLGDGSAPAGTQLRDTFEQGVRLGGRGNALTAAVTLAYSLVLPRLLQRFGTTKVYMFSQAVEAVCLLSARYIRGTPGQASPSAFVQMMTMLDIGMFGVVWATTMGVPWTLIGDALEKDVVYARRIGLYTTLFNASQSFPQLVVAFAAPLVMGFSGDDASSVMFLGGVVAILGGILVAVFDVENTGETEEEEENGRWGGEDREVGRDGVWNDE